MNELRQFDNNCTLAVESSGKQLRLIIYRDEKEWVCRKESRHIILRFLEAENAQLFRGRLRLHKQQDAILVEVKGTIIGSLSEESFHKLLNTSLNPVS